MKTQSVRIRSVTLTRIGSGAGRYEGTFATTPAPAVNGDGALSVGHGDVVSAEYIDADDGQGGTNVVVTDSLPAGVTFVSTTGCAEDPNVVPTCTLGTIPAGGSASLSNWRVYPREYLFEVPLLYLHPENGGFDPETGNTNIRQALELQIFGETVSGKNVATEKIPIAFNFFCAGQ